MQDFGARDPTIGEIESDFANKTLWNWDTSHLTRYHRSAPSELTRLGVHKGTLIYWAPEPGLHHTGLSTCSTAVLCQSELSVSCAGIMQSTRIDRRATGPGCKALQ
jgi:hypothetical protein